MTQQADAVVTTQLIEQAMPQLQADLEELVTYPSINFPDYDLAPVRACADACARMFAAAGADVELIPCDKDVPAISATLPGPEGAPTVLLYAHYDVQPAGDMAAWDSEPFTAELRDGRLYGRGAADDKSGVVAHLACVRALAGASPVNLRVLLEGEEEFGGAFENWPANRAEVFDGVDVVVVSDMGTADLGQPTFTTALRGIVAARSPRAPCGSRCTAACSAVRRRTR